MNRSEQAAVFLATGGYIGMAPLAPGSFGSLLGLPLFWFMSRMTTPYAAACLAALILIGIWASGQAEKLLGKKDPASVVIDEIAGMGVVFIGLPFSWPVAIAGYIVFRVVDIIKPFPVNWLESRMAGGTGVMVDDLAAGLVTRLLLWIAGHAMAFGL